VSFFSEMGSWPLLVMLKTSSLSSPQITAA
jgi:hypothetical protein